MDRVKSDHDINHLIIIKNPLTNQRRGLQKNKTIKSGDTRSIYLTKLQIDCITKYDNYHIKKPSNKLMLRVQTNIL